MLKAYEDALREREAASRQREVDAFVVSTLDTIEHTRPVVGKSADATARGIDMQVERVAGGHLNVVGLERVVWMRNRLASCVASIDSARS